MFFFTNYLFIPPKYPEFPNFLFREITNTVGYKKKKLDVHKWYFEFPKFLNFVFYHFADICVFTIDICVFTIDICVFSSCFVYSLMLLLKQTKNGKNLGRSKLMTNSMYNYQKWYQGAIGQFNLLNLFKIWAFFRITRTPDCPDSVFVNIC